MQVGREERVRKRVMGRGRGRGSSSWCKAKYKGTCGSLSPSFVCLFQKEDGSHFFREAKRLTSSPGGKGRLLESTLLQRLQTA